MWRIRVFEWHKKLKKEHKDVKYDFRSGRPSISSDRWLIAWIILSRPDMKKRKVFGSLSLNIWVYLKSSSNGFDGHPAVSDREEHRQTETTSLFTWSCPVWLFSFLQVHRDHQETPLRRYRGHQEGRNDGSECHQRCIFPAAYKKSGREEWESAFDSRGSL